MDHLAAVSQKLGEAMYGQGARPAAAAAPPKPRPTAPVPPAAPRYGGEGKKKDDDVIDAEYEVKE